MSREHPNKYLSSSDSTESKPLEKTKKLVIKLPRPSKRVIRFGLAVIIVVLGIIFGFTYPRRGGEVGRITREIASVIELPTEKPSIVTITDRSKLSQQSFFEQAQNGDKILVYPKAQKVILYRPSIHKVVDIAPVIGSASPTTN